MSAKRQKRSPEAIAKMKATMARPDVKARMAAAQRGRKHSEETKAKMSASKRGKTLSAEHIAALRSKVISPETRAKLRATALGRRHTPETIAKLRAISTGRKHTPEAIAKLGKKATAEHRASLRAAHKRPDVKARHSGSNNGRWLGGISFEPYGLGFNVVLKAEIRERDGNECRLCGQDRETLGQVADIHHIDYDKQNNAASNLVSLCRKCHSKTTFEDRSGWMAYFQVMMAIEMIGG